MSNSLAQSPKTLPWNLESFRDAHLPHRINILRAFVKHWKRFTQSDHEIRLCLKDAAMITCRSLWELLGVQTGTKEDDAEPADPTKLSIQFGASKLIFPKGVTVRSIKPLEFLRLNEAIDVLLVLVAANKCVAHLDAYPNHGVTEDILERAVNATLREVKARISPPPKGL